MDSIPFQTILVAIDESDISDKAFVAAKELAKALSAKLIVAHVLDPHNDRSPQPLYSIGESYGEAGGFQIDRGVRERYEREWTAFVSYYESLLKQKVDEATAAGIEAEFVQLNGSAGSALCEAAKTANVSLLVTGSHQRRGMAEIMLGSTSNYITHYAPCSVMVVYNNDIREALDKEVSETTESKDVAAA